MIQPQLLATQDRFQSLPDRVCWYKPYQTCSLNENRATRGNAEWWRIKNAVMCSQDYPVVQEFLQKRLENLQDVCRGSPARNCCLMQKSINRASSNYVLGDCLDVFQQKLQEVVVNACVILWHFRWPQLGHRNEKPCCFLVKAKLHGYLGRGQQLHVKT